jgi:hypothetical protein
MTQLPAETRLLALGLLNYADDEGYFRAHPALIRGELMPFTESTAVIPPMLQELVAIGYLSLHQAKDSTPIGHITNFLRHQSISKPRRSELRPALEASATPPNASSTIRHTPPGILPESSETPLSGNGMEWNGKGMEVVLAPHGAEPPPVPSPGSTMASPKPSSEKKKKGGAADEALSWTAETGWSGFTDTLMDELAAAYPACDIRRQMLVMEQWLKANPAKAKKQNWRRFVTNWLAKEQDRGGDLRGRTPFQAFMQSAAEKKEAPPLTAESPPEGFEQAMAALWGEGWEGTVPGWPQMVASDKAQVRRWLAQHGKEAE